MTAKGQFLTRTYGAYFHRDVPEPDDELARVGPGTPCGEYLRRFWQPVAHCQELSDLPVAVRVMGEDLVLFRDRSGRVGLLERHCSHRGTSLEFGLVAERGIRCCYHGWLFDVDGRILETPGEPAGSTLKDRLCHGAYPVREYGGLVFAYMGPPEKLPPFPVLDTFEFPGFRLELGDLDRNVKPCNWLQVQDNVVDIAHEVFLHARVSGLQINDAGGRPLAEILELGELDFVETPAGILCMETRRVGDSVWIRTIEHVAPNIAQIPQTPALPPKYPEGRTQISVRPRATRWRVPIDDYNTIEFSFARVREGEQNTYTKDASLARRSNFGDRPYEEKQRHPGDYDAQISQRPLAIHALEHLGATDRGVIMFRKMVRDGIRAVQRGEDPKGLDRRAAGAIPTYGHETLLRVPPAATPEEDQALLRTTARQVTERFLRDPLAAAGGVVEI
jgi:phenylpropionate dioxygenase-like ring-hydroxylating dioxygenase large terminal subunit